MRLSAVAIASLLVLSNVVPVHAQDRASVVAAYRAYEAALVTGDVAGADAAGEQAWRAAEAVWGETNAQTAILAFNLADLRVQQGQYAEAMEPAERALAIVRGNTLDLGIPQTELAILAARAAYGAQANRRSRARLLEALEDEAANASRYSIEAWTQLGVEAAADRRWELAEKAFLAAEQDTRQLAPNDMLSQGVLASTAGAAIMNGRGSLTNEARLVQRVLKALSAFDRAITFFPEAQIGEPMDPSLAQARAWRAASIALLAAIDKDEADAYRERVRDPQTPSRCTVEWEHREDPRYPGGALFRGYVGAVLVEFDIADDGVVVAPRILAEVPAERFGQSILKALPKWRVGNAQALSRECRTASRTEFLFVIRD